jgi:hypothetical protein
MLPQFIDRGGNTVYHVHHADPDCRILRAGKMIAMTRYNESTMEMQSFEPLEQIEIDLPKPKGGKK